MAARFWVGGTGTWDASDTTHWAATSGGASGASVPGSSDTVTFDGASGGGTVTVGYDPSVISITGGAFTGTLDFATSNPTMQTFNFSGTGTRTLNMGSGTWTITGSNATIFTVSTVTNLTMNYQTATVNCTYSGSVGTRAFVLGSASSDTSGHLYNLNISAGSDTFNLTASGSVNIRNDLDFTGFSGTLTTGTSNYYGNVTLSTGMTWGTSSTSNIIFKATSAKLLDTKGKTISQPFIFDGVGGSWTLQNDLLLASSRAVTLTNGIFNANNYNVTCGAFASSNSNIRTLTMGSGQWTITGNAVTVWDIATFTNLTFNKGSLPIVLAYSGSTGTRTINSGAITPLQLSSAPDFNIIAGTDIINTVSTRVGHLNFTGFSGTLASGTRVVYGDLTLSSGMTWTSGTAVTTFGGTSGTQTITTNGVACNSPFTVDGVGGTVTLAGNFSMDGASARTLTLTNGTFNANGFNVTCGAFASSNSNTRTLTMGSGTWTLTGTSTVWNFTTTTGLTYNVNTSTVVVADTSSSSKTIVAPSSPAAFYNLTITGGGSGAIIWSGTVSRAINTLTITGPKTIQWAAGGTYVVADWNVQGTSGNNVVFNSTTPGSTYTFSKSAGLVEVRYVTLQDSIATGGAYFQAVNSTDSGNNTGWNFATASAGGGLQAGKKFAAFGGARPINKVLDSQLHGYRKLGG